MFSVGIKERGQWHEIGLFLFTGAVYEVNSYIVF